MKCTNCGEAVPNSAKVCGNCGHRLKEGAPPQAPSARPSAQEPGSLESRANPLTLRGMPTWVWAVGLLVILSIGYLFLSREKLTSDAAFAEQENTGAEQAQIDEAAVNNQSLEEEAPLQVSEATIDPDLYDRYPLIFEFTDGQNDCYAYDGYEPCKYDYVDLESATFYMDEDGSVTLRFHFSEYLPEISSLSDEDFSFTLGLDLDNNIQTGFSEFDYWPIERNIGVEIVIGIDPVNGLLASVKTVDGRELNIYGSKDQSNQPIWWTQNNNFLLVFISGELIPAENFSFAGDAGYYLEESDKSVTDDFVSTERSGQGLTTSFE